MCGAFAVSTFMFFHGFKPRFDFEPRYNVRPTQDAPIITQDGIDLARFGLVPPWEKEFSTKFSTFNARSESIETSKLYSRLLKDHRCIIPTTGFFEWKKVDSKTKQPMFIKLKDRKQFFFAGIYDTWHKGDKDEHKSFSIITTRPNSFMATIHDRMPVILEKDEEKPWIFEDEYIDFKQVLDPYPNNQMEAYQVSTLVNRPVNDSPVVIEKLGS